MIRLTHPLFPNLVRQGEVSFKSWSDSNKTTDLYRLDWSHLDEIKRKRFVDDARTSSMVSEYPGTLPEPYNSWIQKLVFTIPVDYMEEIRRCSRVAQLEYCTPRHFDTMIRGICLEPAISYIYVAFRMIADCVYDPDTNYFYRGPDKIIIPQALLYKFWCGQTGYGLLKDHSWFKKITWMLDSDLSKNDTERKKEVKKFIDCIDKFEEKLRKMSEIRCADSLPITTTSSETENNIYHIKGNKLEADPGDFIIKKADPDSSGMYISASPDCPITFTGNVEVTFDNKENIKAIDAVKESDLDFGTFSNKMGLEILKSQWYYSKITGILNIDCGNLRRLGKTTFLKELMKKYYEKTENLQIALITITKDIGQENYGDLQKEGVISFITSARSALKDLKGKNKILIFSDEITDAQEVFKNWPGATYVAGFYGEGAVEIKKD